MASMTLINNLNNLLDVPLTQEQEDWISESQENYEFAKDGYNTHLNGGLFDVENKVILTPEFVNNEKIKCVYDKLNEHSNLRDILSDFFEDDNQVNLIFDAAPISNCESAGHPNGCTQAIRNPELSAVKIIIGEEYINESTYQGQTKPTALLFLARTLLHEAIHANLYLATNNLNNSSNLDFLALYEQYRNLVDWQHEIMADHYLSIIANGLQNVHPHLGDQQFINYNSDYDWNQYYEYISLQGLEVTEYFNDNFPQHSENRDQFDFYVQETFTLSNSNKNCN